MIGLAQSADVKEQAEHIFAGNIATACSAEALEGTYGAIYKDFAAILVNQAASSRKVSQVRQEQILPYILVHLVDFQLHWEACPLLALLALAFRIRYIANLAPDPLTSQLWRTYEQHRTLFVQDGSDMLAGIWGRTDAELRSDLLKLGVGGKGSTPHKWNQTATRLAVLSTLSTKDDAMHRGGPWMISLTRAERDNAAVYTEDAILQRLFDVVGAKYQYYLEIGVERVEDSRGRWLRALDWHGMTFGKSLNEPFMGLQSRVVRPHTLGEFISWARPKHSHALSRGIDLLGLHSAGCDHSAYAQWRSLEPHIRPRVVLAEADAKVNPLIWSVASHADQTPGSQLASSELLTTPLRTKTSMRAMQELAQQKGYGLVHATLHTMFFVRSDILKQLHYGYGIVFEHLNDISYFWRRWRHHTL